jgi:hypothetical protein
MPVYTTKLTVSLSLREVREVFDDPFKFAGVSGHISLLMGLGPQDEEPFFFDQADSPPTRFRASFLFGNTKRPNPNVLRDLREGATPLI